MGSVRGSRGSLSREACNFRAKSSTEHNAIAILQFQRSCTGGFENTAPCDLLLLGALGGSAAAGSTGGACGGASPTLPRLPGSALARLFLECSAAAGLRGRRPSGWAAKSAWWPGLQGRAPELCWGLRGQPPAPEQDTFLQQNENRTETQGGLGPHHSQPCVTM